MRLSLLPLLALAAPATAQTAAEISTGVEYDHGKYGTGQRVETTRATNAVRIQSGRLTVVAALPWQRVEAPGNVVAGGGGGLLGIIVDPSRPSDRRVREGFGDLRVGAAYRTDAPGGVDLTLSAEAKLPTAARGLGTGAPDVAVAAEAAKRIGSVTPFVAVGYSVPGNPEGYELRDGLSARAGVAAELAPRVRGHVAYGHAQSPSPLVSDERQVSAGVDAGVSPRLNLGIRGTAGLSEGAPSVGAGVRLGWRIF